MKHDQQDHSEPVKLPAVDIQYQPQNPIDQHKSGLGDNKPSKSSKRSIMPSKKAWWIKPLLVFIVLIIVLVVASIWIIRSTSNQSTGSSSSRSVNDGQPITSSSLDDLSMACSYVPITNSPSGSNPSNGPFAVFVESTEPGQYFHKDTVITGTSPQIDSNNYLNAQIVVCVDVLKTYDTDTRCNFKDKDSTKQRSLYLYNVDYEVNFITARSGKKIYSTKRTAKAEQCPLSANFSASAPKIYAQLSDQQINQAVAEYKKEVK